MNAIEFFDKDGKSVGVFSCSVCKRIKFDRESADNCCSCSDCGIEIPAFKTTCNTCFDLWSTKQNEERRKKTLASAQILEDYQGLVYWDDGGSEVARYSSFFTRDNDGFYFDMDDLLSSIQKYNEDNEEGAKIEIPELVFCCKERKFQLNISGSIESALENMYEDAGDDLEGETELQEAVDAFNDRNSGLISYDPDFKHMVRVPKEV